MAAVQRTTAVVVAAIKRAIAEPLQSAAPAQRGIAVAGAARALALTVMQRSNLAGKHECRPGCAFCCHTAVTVSPTEAFAIADYLREHCDADALAAVRTKLDANAATAAQISRDEYIAQLVPCGLLTDDGNCRAHPVRPLACAGFLSTSRAACEAEFRRAFGRGPVPIDPFAMTVGLAASQGLLEGCTEGGLDGQFYELHHALRRVLDDPAAAARWAHGEPVFADCLR